MICIEVFAAATEQWSSPVFSHVAQIRADGGGGCALVGQDGTYTNTIMWFDKKGNILFSKTYHGYVTIAAVTKKYCAYSFREKDTDFAYLIQVDRKGNETVVQDEDVSMEAPGKYTKVLEDKKGYFLVIRDIIDNRQKVTRFTYK